MGSNRCIRCISFAFQKQALDEIGVSAFTCIRYLGMVALAWAVVLGRRAAGQPIGIARADLPRFAVAGLFGHSSFIVLSTVGLARTTAFSTALLVGTAPLFAALLLWACRLEPIPRGEAAGMVVAFAGVLVFLADKMVARLSDAGLGDMLCLAGALFFAAYSVVSKPLGTRYALPVMMAYTSTIANIAAGNPRAADPVQTSVGSLPAHTGAPIGPSLTPAWVPSGAGRGRA